jgi:hypothetical protein
MFELRCSEFELGCSESAGQPQGQGIEGSKSSMIPLVAEGVLHHCSVAAPTGLLIPFNVELLAA